MDLNSYNYLEYGDNNTTASGSIGSCERFLMGENLEHFIFPLTMQKRNMMMSSRTFPKKASVSGIG